MSRETGRNCKACERWEVTQWGLMVSACSAELNSRTGNKGFLLHPHAHRSCTVGFLQAAGFSPTQGVPLLTTAPTLLLVHSHVPACATCNSQPFWFSHSRALNKFRSFSLLLHSQNRSWVSYTHYLSLLSRYPFKDNTSFV